MAWSSRPFLELCSQINDAHPVAEFQPGQKIARNFADLGPEEFYVLPGGKVVSIFTGQVTKLAPEHGGHLFIIPTCDEMVNEILKRGFEIQALSFVEQRSWHLCISKGGGGDVYEFESSDLELVLGRAMDFAMRH